MLGKARVSAKELATRDIAPAARGMSALPSNLVSGITGAPAVELRASGLRVRFAECSADGSAGRHAFWGEDAAGKLVAGTALLPRLDNVVMRASVASETTLGDARDHGWLLILDPDAKRDKSARGCALPPGPTEADGILELHVAAGRTTGSGIHRCRVPTSTWIGTCALLPDGTFCD